MKSLIFSTGNTEKFRTAHDACAIKNIDLQQVDIEITEIQEEDPEKVAIDKAQKAFAAIKKPLVITDDSWAFSGLNGFPGVYMHSMNHWFTPEDFLRLTKPLKDRGVILTQYLVFVDGPDMKVFSHQTQGILLNEVKGTSDHPSHTVISLEGDNGLSIAEAYDVAIDKSSRRSGQVWHDFTAWYIENAPLIK